ncbi:MAG: RING finger protein [Promethearchaeati archaeon SRVP18_Atabeyarchaeia-1]
MYFAVFAPVLILGPLIAILFFTLLVVSIAVSTNGRPRSREGVATNSPALRRTQPVTRFSTRFCPYCGATLKSQDQSFCHNCGSNLEATQRAMTSSSQEESDLDLAKRLSMVSQELLCAVCHESITKTDPIVFCPHCGTVAHRDDFLVWIHTRGLCPSCSQKLDYKVLEDQLPKSLVQSAMR